MGFSKTSDSDSLTELISHLVSYVGNEATILARYELNQEESFPKLWPNDTSEEVAKRMGCIEEHLGGPPEFYLLRTDQAAPAADNYPYAVLREVTDVFRRARQSVLRAHVFMTGAQLLKDHSDFVRDQDPNAAKVFAQQAADTFWEHAEAAFIRICSFWDRIGQVLDFAFFNIRKFDQNGFNAVMDRIAANVVPMKAALKGSGSWTRLRSFQTSERDDGLKWLLLRRNLIIHSLHLHPVKDADDGVFVSQFNHLETAHREKLRPRDPPGEVDLLLGQLGKAAALFDDCLRIVELSPNRKQKII